MTCDEAKEKAYQWLSDQVGLDASNVNEFTRTNSQNGIEYLLRDGLCVGAVQIKMTSRQGVISAGTIENNEYKSIQRFEFV